MQLNTIEHPVNFNFLQSLKNPYTLGKRSFDFRIKDLGSDVHRIEVRSRTWKSNYSLADLDGRSFGDTASETTVRLERSAELSLTKGGRTLFRSSRDVSFGVCGTKWLFQFEHHPNMRFYGMGEKNNGFEKSGVRTQFWNVDVMGAYPPALIENQVTDPMYIAIPYLLVRLEEGWLGLLVDNPFAVFMGIAAGQDLVQADESEGASFYVGSPDGTPVVYFIYGQSADEVTCRLQRLCGTTPLPPLWALGHHQSRWGYRAAADLIELERQFALHAIPNDGLWLDIDYMDGYRVFTVDPAAFPDPAATLAELHEKGARVVPILDPGVKVDKKFAAYRDASQRELLCRTSENREFVAYVWPGQVAFPDFSLVESRGWWADRVRTLRAMGFDGFWLDMNEPATGSVSTDEMRFDHGRQPHATFHNQYALGMQMATRQAFDSEEPARRPFLLSRSGFIGTSRYAAVWTGDNVSNYHHLAGAIPMALNLSLSGLPFNGHDVPGFGGDASEELALAWYKAAFLFPFLRNHCWKEGRRQEPWAFGRRAEKIIGHFVSLRYKLLPYLYGLFIEQEEIGRPLLRPLFYVFNDKGMETIADQFMVGTSIMQAPILANGANNRRVRLPEGRWFSPWDGRWLRGDREIVAAQSRRTTPLYVPEGAVIPMQSGVRTNNRNNLQEIELHLFVSSKYEGKTSYTYSFDDGESFAYREGARTSILFTVSRELRNLLVDAKPLAMGAGECRVRFFVYDVFGALIVRSKGREDDMEALALKSEPWIFAGARVSPFATVPVTIAPPPGVADE